MGSLQGGAVAGARAVIANGCRLEQAGRSADAPLLVDETADLLKA
jgi:hypothetical protein